MKLKAEDYKSWLDTVIGRWEKLLEEENGYVSE